MGDLGNTFIAGLVIWGTPRPWRVPSPKPPNPQNKLRRRRVNGAWERDEWPYECLYTTTHNNTQHITTQTHTPLRAHCTRPLREVKDPNLPFHGLVIISAVEIVIDDAVFI